MTASSELAKIVRVTVTRRPSGMYVAESPDLRGFLAMSHDLDVLGRLIPEHIRDLYEAMGQPVVVSRLAEACETDGQPWVAVPLAVVERQRVIA